MNVAISNIAWNPEEDKDILFLLKKYAISGIEIAPTMIWKEPTKESTKSIMKYKKFWNDEGINIVSIQSLLFGHPELLIFHSEENRKKTLSYIDKMFQVFALLGVEDIVFGSPANRDRGKMSKVQAFEIAAEFFYTIGVMAKKYGLFFCIEPIPQEYGTNFINNTNEGIALVKRVDHPHFRLHLDSGALTIKKENYKKSIEKAFPYLKHFHISERNLLQIGSTDVDHKTIAKTLKDLHFDNWLSIEMRRNDKQSNYKNVEKILKFVSKLYQ